MNQQTATYAVNYLTHYTHTLETLLTIIGTGLAKPQCDRPVLSCLGYPDFYRVFGITSLTEICLESSAYHRSKFGNFGVALTRDWATRLHLQSVIYIPRSGVIFEHVKAVLSDFRNVADEDFQASLPIGERGKAFIEFALRGSTSRTQQEARNRVFLRNFQQLQAWDLPRILINYAEFDDHRCEMEWRGISTRHPHDSLEKSAQIAEATKPMAPETHGWHYDFQHDTSEVTNDRFGLLRDWPATPFKVEDVSFFCCPPEHLETLRAALPKSFAHCEIRAIY